MDRPGDRSRPAAMAARREATRARRTHPATLWFGPAFGVAERTEAGWRVSELSDPTPRAARAGLGRRLRALAGRSTGSPEEEAFGEAPEVVVNGRRFRVVRADRFLRYGPAGPEPPRPTDPDTVAGPRGELLPRGERPGGAALLGERWEAVPRGPLTPFEVTHDARRALTTHPRVALLRPRYAVAERTGGHWPARSGAVPSPREARRALVAYLREASPDPVEEELAAALRFGRDGTHEVRVGGRVFSVIRLETAVRVGPDGPEPPRPSDHRSGPPRAPETGAPHTASPLDG